jgi:hypothetical protein
LRDQSPAAFASKRAIMGMLFSWNLCAGYVSD